MFPSNNTMNRLRTSSSFIVLLSLFLSALIISCGDAAATNATPQSTLNKKSGTTQKLLRRPQLDSASPLFGIVGKINSDSSSSSATCVRGGDCCDSTPILMGKVGVGAGE